MTEDLRELVARLISQTPVMRGAYSVSQSPGGAHEELADKILAIPRLRDALAALERDEAMARKLGHTIPVRMSGQSEGVAGLDD